MTKSTSTRSGRSQRPSPAERLLVTATELFQRYGIRVVGIDRILKESGVAKASLYKAFGSKDDLVSAYIKAMDDRDRADWNWRADIVDHPLEKILVFFDKASDDEKRHHYRGSFYANAATEYPEPETPGELMIRQAVAAHHQWLNDTIAGLCRQAGLSDEANVAELTRRVRILYDGGRAGAKTDRSVAPIRTARRMAAEALQYFE